MLTESQKFVIHKIEENKQTFTDISDTIWELAELSLKEYQSAAAYCKLLEELGFEVEKNLCGLETSFSGSFGCGRPIIGILGEFDALSGLSQEGSAVERKEIVKNGSGHGCGHNMLGAGALAAAYGVKCYIEEQKKKDPSFSGTVIFYGCPGEEGGASKALFARENLWKKLDCALTWHPEDVNEVVVGTCNSCIQTLYKFNGVASHAAGDPENGRSALDAVELMNVGVQYLREHMKSDARIHYAIVNGGGLSPNVVQREASVLYMVRSVLAKDAVALQERVDKIAQGAAMMTETTVEKVFIDACSNTVPNHVLEHQAQRLLNEVPLPEYTEEEWNYAKELKKTITQHRLPSIAAEKDSKAAEYVKKMSENGERAINDFIAPLYEGDYFMAGSTDVGDVSWETPTSQIHTSSFISGSPGHSWQNVSCGKSSIGHKGLIHAGKVLAAQAIELFENPEILQQAKAEFEVAVQDGYTCPIPDGETLKIVEM